MSLLLFLLKLRDFIILLQNLYWANRFNNELQIIIYNIKYQIIIGLLENSNQISQLEIIFQIVLNILKKELTFILTRMQFFICPYFAITVKKAQKELFQTIGLDLLNKIFTYKNLYIIVSQVTNMVNFIILLSKIAEVKTANIMYLKKFDHIKRFDLEIIDFVILLLT